MARRLARASAVSGERAAEVALGAFQQAFERRIVQPAQHQHLAAREQGAVEREGRVLRGRADQRDDSGLDHGQERVLLGAIEAVHLIDQQQRALPGGAALRRLLERPLEVGDAGEHGGKLDEMQPRAVGEQARDGGLAHPRRPPEDQRGKAAALQHPRDRALRPEQMVLAHHVLERRRAQPVGERRGRRRARVVELFRH